MSSTANYSSLADDDLVRMLALGDTAALEEVSVRHARVCFSLAMRILGDNGWAEEVTQDVLLRLWRKPEMYDPSRGELRKWLLSLTHHAAVDQLRGRRGTARRLDSGPDPLDLLAYGEDDPGEVAWKTVRAEMILGALSKLPPAQRQALEMAYYEGLSQSEIAARTGQPLGSVKTRIRLGMSKLRVLLRQTGVDE